MVSRRDRDVRCESSSQTCTGDVRCECDVIMMMIMSNVFGEHW